MRQLEVSATLSLPLDWITLSTVVYGARGAGKTTLGRVVAEEAHANAQRFCAVDLKGDWWGLKSSASGSEDGLPVVIFGGDHADLPLEPEAGADIAETVAGLHHSAILDLEYLSKGKQLRFLAAFFDRLYDRNREPLLLLLDESQRYAPQRPMNPDATMCLGAVEDLVKLGRKHGIGPVLFTQRGSGLNKEVSELCDMLVAFRTPGPLDQDRIKDWLDANVTRDERDQVMSKLSGLATGTAIFASGHPGLKVFSVADVRAPRTFDSSATPRIGQRAKAPRKMAPVELEALRERMAEAIERAKADDPKELRKRIAELDRQLANAGAALVEERRKVPQTVEKTIEVPVLSAEDRRLLTEAWMGATKLATDFEEAAERIAEKLRSFNPAPAATAMREFAARTQREPTEKIVLKDQPDPRYNGVYAVPEGSVAMLTDGEVKLGAADRAFLSALATHRDGLSKKQLSLITGYSAKSGYFGNTLGKLRSAGLVEKGSDPIRITSAGVVAAGDVEQLPHPGQPLIDYWRSRLSKAERAFLDAFVGAYPDHVAKDALSEITGYSASSGYFGNTLGRLRSLGLVDGFRASRELMGR